MAPSKHQLYKPSVSQLEFQILLLPAEVKTLLGILCFMCSMFRFSSWDCLMSNLTFTPLSPPKPKDPVSAAVPAPGRNNSQIASGQNQPQAAAGSHQLSVGQPHNAAGPSPHTLRRGKQPPSSLPSGKAVQTSLSQCKDSDGEACGQIFSMSIVKSQAENSVIQEKSH